MADKVYKWTDDPMLGGISDCDPDIINDCLMSLKYENTSDAIQNMYTTGEVETQTRAFEQLKQMKRSTFDKSKFTVVGSPTITDEGIASGFSRSDYLKITDNISLGSGKWKIEFEFLFINTGNNQAIFSGKDNAYAPLIYVNSKQSAINIPSSNGTWGVQSKEQTTSYQFSDNIKYKGYLEFTGTKYNLAFKSENESSYTVTNTVTSNTLCLEGTGSFNLCIGSNPAQADRYVGGQINIKQFSITVGDKEVFNGNKTGLDVIKPDNYTVVGSPVISADGVASGFSINNSTSILTPSINFGSSFILEIKFKLDGIPSYQSLLGKISDNNASITMNVQKDGSLRCTIKDNSFASVASLNSSNGLVVTNVWYTVKIVWTGIVYQLFLKTDNTGYTQVTEDVSSTTAPKTGQLRLGADKADVNYGQVTGSIDLNSFKIYVDGNLVYQPCLKIPYTLSKTGSKIVDVEYRDRVIDLYEQEGQARYFTIDETNKNFTLPMGEIYGMIEDSKKGYHPPLLSTMWSDHLLNDMSWLRADTFSWQDGNTYSLAYNELLSEYNNSASVSTTEGSITFKRTPKGYKIALSTQETAILNKYNADGIAWYYILDTTNKKFKLPRTKFGFEGLRNSVGNDIAESLPNIKGTANMGGTGGNDGSHPINIGTTTGAFSNVTTGTAMQRSESVGSKPIGLSIDASRSSSTYQDGAPVQERATQMYLYFYVGEFTKSTEVQTAGLKAELLNGKADVNTPSIQAPYIKNTYVNGTSGYIIWSNGNCVQWGTTVLSATTTSISYLKTFLNNDYALINSKIYSSTNWTGSDYILSKTQNGFTAYSYSTQTHDLCWVAIGKLASGQY